MATHVTCTDRRAGRALAALGVGGCSLLLIACGGSTEANAPPVITAQPADQAAVEGRPATFGVGVSGVPVPSLQWERMEPGGSTWAAIPGASSRTYPFIPSRPDDGTRFRVQATNALGAATSNPATSTANPPHKKPGSSEPLSQHASPEVKIENPTNPTSSNLSRFCSPLLIVESSPSNP